MRWVVLRPLLVASRSFGILFEFFPQKIPKISKKKFKNFTKNCKRIAKKIQNNNSNKIPQPHPPPTVPGAQGGTGGGGGVALGCVKASPGRLPPRSALPPLRDPTGSSVPGRPGTRPAGPMTAPRPARWRSRARDTAVPMWGPGREHRPLAGDRRVPLPLFCPVQEGSGRGGSGSKGGGGTENLKMC